MGWSCLPRPCLKRHLGASLFLSRVRTNSHVERAHSRDRVGGWPTLRWFTLKRLANRSCGGGSWVTSRQLQTHMLLISVRLFRSCFVLLKLWWDDDDGADYDYDSDYDVRNSISLLVHFHVSGSMHIVPSISCGFETTLARTHLLLTELCVGCK